MEQDTEKEVCQECGGTGEIELQEYVTGDNIIPGGFYQGTGRFKPCVCKE